MVDKRIKLIRMEDPYTKLKEGDMGTISGEDGLGHILVKWDNGSNLHLIPEIDEFEILEGRIAKFKLFQELKSESTYIETKLEELTDLIENFNYTFDWIIENNNIKAEIEMLDQEANIKWKVDLKSMKIEETTQQSGDVDFWSEEISSIDEAFEIIEKEIHYWLDITENFK